MVQRARYNMLAQRYLKTDIYLHRREPWGRSATGCNVLGQVIVTTSMEFGLG